MDLGIDREKLFLAGKFIFLVSVITVSSQFIGRELIEFYYLEDTQPPEMILSRPLRRTPWYQVLPKDSIIYSAKEEVEKKRGELASEKEDFLFIDLDAMTLDQYKEGEVRASYEVKAKGEEGSFSETPNGFYKLQGKERNHFSRIHRVWMPWSMHFFGNYFIHGWPYLPNGTPIRGTTSGGCIRLLSADAAAIYRSVNIGTPILVSTSKATPAPEFSYIRRLPTKHENPRVLNLSAESVLIADIDSGEILAEKNRKKILPAGPLTKIMTALIASEAIRDDTRTFVSRSLAEEYGDETQFRAGETFLAGNLLEPLLLSSSNIAAELLRRASWNFVGTMNEKALSIGLYNTKFENSTGAGAENGSTAEDMFRLMRFIFAHKRPLFAITAQKSYTLKPYAGGIREELESQNWPLDDSRFLGGFSGNYPDKTQAAAAVFKVPFSEYGDRHVGIILFKTRDRIKDARASIEYLQDQFVYGSVRSPRWKILPPSRDGNALYPAPRPVSP